MGFSALSGCSIRDMVHLYPTREAHYDVATFRVQVSICRKD